LLVGHFSAATPFSYAVGKPNSTYVAPQECSLNATNIMRDGNIELSSYLTKTESFQHITATMVIRNLMSFNLEKTPHWGKV